MGVPKIKATRKWKTDLKITKKWLMKNRTRKGGWTQSQVEALGVIWPPKQHWTDALVGQSITEEARLVFEAKEYKMAKTSNCRDCGAEIAFEKNKNDRWAPVHPESRQPHRCETERICEDCKKTFKGASWMKVCGDCFRGRGSSPDSSPAPASEPRTSEPLQDDMSFDDDKPPF